MLKQTQQSTTDLHPEKENEKYLRNMSINSSFYDPKGR